MDTITFKDGPDVELIRCLASDEDVITAMLVSTKGFIDSESYEATVGDSTAQQGRINFLMKGRHGTPFEHNQFVFFVRAGIFVFREFHRHRIGWSYNEESGRYKQLEPIFYVPALERPLTQTGKPGAYHMVPAPELHPTVVEELCEAYETEYARYERLLALGIAKEVARMCLPVGINTSMYATCNARSLMSFLSLRTDEPESVFPSKPQYEIEQVARKLEVIFSEIMPLTYKAWNDNGRVSP